MLIKLFQQFEVHNSLLILNAERFLSCVLWIVSGRHVYSKTTANEVRRALRNLKSSA